MDHQSELEDRFCVLNYNLNADFMSYKDIFNQVIDIGQRTYNIDELEQLEQLK